MSMMLMVQAMELKVGNPLRKIVLLKLADNANDQGECWPSHAHIAELCEVSKSSVKSHIKKLAEDGFLRIETRAGGVKGNLSNIYHLTLDAKKQAQAEEKKAINLGQNLTHPESEFNLGVGQDLTHPEPAANPPSVNCCPTLGQELATESVIEPVIEPVIKKHIGKSHSKFDFSHWPESPSDEKLKILVEHRKAIKKPLNQSVINLHSQELCAAARDGYSVDDCIDVWAGAGWVGFKFEWMLNRLGQSGSRQGNPMAGATGIYERLTDTTWASPNMRGMTE